MFRGQKITLFLVLFSSVLLGLFSTVVSASDFKDTPYFSGMPNYKIGDAADNEFDEYRFFNGKDDCITVEGKKFHRAYTLREDAQQASELQISRNYANAVKNLGGTVIFEGICEGADCAENCGYRLMVGKIIKGDNEIWVEVCPFNDGNDYYITLIVKESMKQDVTASAMLDALNQKGRVALYINFDFGKATLKPDSQPIITQIVDLLNANAGLNLSVEGHTDNVGNPQSNKVLSENRARAVVKEIVAHGIDANRFSIMGHGQDKPIADNNSEEGRALNRRVELVKK